MNQVASEPNMRFGGPNRSNLNLEATPFQNIWGGQPMNLNNQMNQCTYCGKDGHRQGPRCALWCKHRSKRCIPIVRYEDRPSRPQIQQEQRPIAQINAVILEDWNEDENFSLTKKRKSLNRMVNTFSKIRWIQQKLSMLNCLAQFNTHNDHAREESLQ